MSDTPGDKCGISPIQIGGWPVSACRLHDKFYSEGSWAEQNISREEADRRFLDMLLTLSGRNPFKRIASYAMYEVARIFGSSWWEGKK